MEPLIAKKLNRGLKKCPLHKFGSLYEFFAQSFYECNKCHGYHNVGEQIASNVEKNWSVDIRRVKHGIRYAFK